MINNPPTVFPASSRQPVAYLGFGLLLAIPLVLFLYNPGQPLVEHASFRQTQTALTSYWFLHSGNVFKYLTPVLGAPWTVPLEFPLYQVLVAEISRFFGLPLDFTGRMITLCFFYLSCVPIVLVLRRYGAAAVVMGIALFLTAPIDLFFSRTFLIESLATLLALSALGCYVSYMRSGRISYLTAFVAFGTLAGLQKITTFLPVIVVCAADFSLEYLRDRRTQSTLRAASILALLCSSMLVPLLWALYSDSLKATGLLSSWMTSGALREWNFGTLALRLQPDFWIKVFGTRILALGGFTVWLLLIIMAIVKKKACWNREFALFLCVGLGGPLFFANLHYVHDYYQIGSLAFLACAAAICTAAYVQELLQSSPARFAGLIAVLVTVNITLFAIRYWPMLNTLPPNEGAALKVAAHLRENQKAEDVSVIVGMDWNSTIPYYSERYALMIPEWIPDKEIALRNPGALLGGRAIGSIVYCDFHQNRHDAVASDRRQSLFEMINGKVENFDNCAVKVKHYQ